MVPARWGAILVTVGALAGGSLPLAVGGCGGGTTIGRVDGGGPTDGAADAAVPDAPPPDAAAPDTAPPADAAGDTAIDFCGTSGPIISVGDGTNTYEVCTNQIAENVFRNALCTCHDVQVAGYVVTRSFDSTLGPPGDTVDDGGGAVGINNHYSISAGYTDVGGSLSIAGPQSLSFVGYLQVRGDLFLEADAFVAGYTQAKRNGWLGGNFLSPGVIDVDGDLHHEGNVTAFAVNVGGANLHEPVSVAPPCDCDPAHLIDVTGIVDHAQLVNDNAAIGLDPAALKNVFWSADLTLPCGRFYLDEISGLAQIIVNVDARVALFIGGDLKTAGNVEFRLAPGAEIDIFVKGNLVITGAAAFGDKDHPAATRLYVGGTNDITLIGAGGFVGNVYAPRALVTAVGYADVWGSIFARDFLSPGYARIFYDRAIQTAGSVCDAPEPPSGTCTQCTVCTGGQACVGGVCGPCTADGDCCGLEVCYNGECVPLIL